MFTLPRTLVALCLVVAFGTAALAASWQPSAGHTQIPIWPGTPPGTHTPKSPETSDVSKELIGGKPVIGVYNVSRPTMTIYRAAGKNTGAAVIVFPGGGYQMLAIDLEGTEVCDWLTPKGITCVLLKYRVPNTGPSWSQRCGCFTDTKSSMALQDAQRTVGIVRFHAAEWHIDPHKIGVLGFSAGGHLSADISTHFQRRVYPPVDDVDKTSCRPDFAVALYPGHLWASEKTFTLNPNVPVTRQVPPTFLLQAENDHIDNVNDSLVYYIALKNAGVPVEMHLYAQGGHAFGLRRTQYPITAWPQLVETWFHTIGMVSR